MLTCIHRTFFFFFFWQRSQTYACNQYISCLNPASNEVSGNRTAYRSNRQMAGFRESAEVKRIPQFDFAQAFRRDTTYSWPLEQNKNERRLQYVAGKCQQSRKKRKKKKKTERERKEEYLNAMGFVKNKSVVIDRMNDAQQQLISNKFEIPEYIDLLFS